MAIRSCPESRGRGQIDNFSMLGHRTWTWRRTANASPCSRCRKHRLARKARSEWFRRGLDSGDISACNTFSQRLYQQRNEDSRETTYETSQRLDTDQPSHGCTDKI